MLYQTPRLLQFVYCNLQLIQPSLFICYKHIPLFGAYATTELKEKPSWQLRLHLSVKFVCSKLIVLFFFYCKNLLIQTKCNNLKKSLN